MMFEDDIREAGAFLDIKKPEWYRRIGVASLDMNSECNCVLGKLYQKGYHWGCEQLGIPYANRYFTLRRAFDDQEWKIFTMEWKAYIRQRKEQHATSIKS